MTPDEPLQLDLFHHPPPPPPTAVGGLQIGDTVEILKHGQFWGRRAEVLGFDGEVVIVQGKGWVIDHRYHVSQLRKVRRDDANDKF